MDNLRLYLRLAWRNVWRHRRRTLIVVLAIGLTMWMMMAYDGLVYGFTNAIYGNAVRVLDGNIQVHAGGYYSSAEQNPMLPLENDQGIIDAALKQGPQVTAALRRIVTGGMATSRDGAFSVNIQGIEPDKEQPSSIEAAHVVDGRYLAADDKDMVFIGKGLAEEMGVGVGDRFTLVGRSAKNETRQHSMTVAGIYDLNMPAVEKRNIYISLGEAQYLYDLPNQTTEVVVLTKDLGGEKPIVNNLKAQFSNVDITTWQNDFPDLENAIATKGMVMNVFGVIIILIAAIGILNMLLMAVFERTREIGLMGALGMYPRNITALFLLEGTMMALVGVAFGILLGVAFNLAFQQVGVDYSSFASMTEYTALISGKIYPTLGTEQLLFRGLTVLIVCFLASLYPAWTASHKEPAAALHYV